MTKQTQVAPTLAAITAILAHADSLAAETRTTRDQVLAVLLYQATGGVTSGYLRLPPIGTVRDAKPVRPVIEDPTTTEETRV